LRIRDHEKIHNLVLEIVNTESFDIECAAYNKIKDICFTNENTALEHPFQWETLGDFTHDDYDRTLSFYFKALTLANRLNLNEYMASVNLAIAEIYQELSNFNEAWHFALSAAQSIKNIVLKQEISEVLLEISKYK